MGGAADRIKQNGHFIRSLLTLVVSDAHGPTLAPTDARFRNLSRTNSRVVDGRPGEQSTLTRQLRDNEDMTTERSTVELTAHDLRVVARYAAESARESL